MCSVLFATTKVTIFREVWEGNFKALRTAIPMVDGSGHTIGRLEFQFLGNKDIVHYQELMEHNWAITVKKAQLDKDEKFLGLPPNEWDPRVKLTAYPGKQKGSTTVLEDCGRSPVWNAEIKVPYVPDPPPCLWHVSVKLACSHLHDVAVVPQV